MNSLVNKMEANLTGMWVSFFTAAGIPSDVAATYALTFTENRIQNDMLLDLNKEYLRDMGITRMGDVIAILRHAKQVHESTARDRVLSSAVGAQKVPVAAVTGRATVAQPSSPASRILERYTRNPQVQEPPAPPLKRKSVESVVESDSNIKKARTIRFAPATQQPPVKEGPPKTVFSRLGNTETTTSTKLTSTKVSSTKVSSTKVSTNTTVKPVFARLGNKTDEQVIPIAKDALKYEGILKSAAVKKVVTVTTSKNNVRKIAMGCTMRADETPVSVKEKLSLPRAKSVKFSNHVEYKEIEAVPKPVVAKTAPKVTQVFNKPERRLSMPETGNSIKGRLGGKNTNNLTITRNVFNRLGV